ncbi:NAD(P)-dependent oxidoreductase [Nocardioides sp. BYT-33-1]|uniref:NAD(P)-dependent oxidoreductase n=1 Tax=Nocardioides sp. BYT-33-1 TaxID=3416952 RepID=UPI003F535B9A
MKLLILGATGPTGRHVIDHALTAGDAVTVLARRPEALADLADRVTVLTGDATSAADVAAAMAGQDAVISALGRGKSVRADGLFSTAAGATVTAADQAGVRRLVWLSSFGVADTYRSASPAQKAMYSSFLRNIYADKKKSEMTIRASSLDWTIVYPTTLTNRPARGTYRVDDRLEMNGAPTIAREDVAHFLHQAAHTPAWIHRDAVISD